MTASRSPVSGRTLWLMLAMILAAALWSYAGAYDRVLWWMEAAPVWVGVAVLALTLRGFRFTALTYWLIFAHMVILLVGARYSYARVPGFDDFFGLTEPGRNNYDKLAHFAQGFIPAAIVREVFVRRGVVARRGWLAFIVACVCLSISAAYELLEWGIAVSGSPAGEDFLGTQGYEWDTQTDMLCALIGAVCMLLLLSRAQDRQIARCGDNSEE